MDALAGLYNTSPGKKKSPKQRRTKTQRKTRKPSGAAGGGGATRPHTRKQTAKNVRPHTRKQTAKVANRPKANTRGKRKLTNRQLAELYLNDKEKIMRDYYNQRNKNILHGERLLQYEDKRYSRNQLISKIEKDLDNRDKERKAITANLVHYFDNLAHFNLLRDYEEKLMIEQDNQLMNQRMFQWFKQRPGKRFFKSDIEGVFPEPEYAKFRYILHDTVPEEGVLGWSIEQIQRTKDIEAGIKPQNSGSNEIYFYAPIFPSLKHPGKSPQYNLIPLFEVPEHSIKGVKTPTPVLAEQANMTPTYYGFDGAGGVGGTPPGGATPDGSPYMPAAAGAGGTPDYGDGAFTPPGGATPDGSHHTPVYGDGAFTPPGGATPDGSHHTPVYGDGAFTPPGGATPDGSPYMPAAAGAGGTPDYGAGKTPSPTWMPSPESKVVVKVDTRPQEEQLVEKMANLSIAPKNTKKKPPCKEGKIRHPETGRCVKPDGPSMKAYYKKQNKN